MSGWGKVTSPINKSAQTTFIYVILPSPTQHTKLLTWLIQAHVSPACLDNKNLGILQVIFKIVER